MHSPTPNDIINQHRLRPISRHPRLQHGCYPSFEQLRLGHLDAECLSSHQARPPNGQHSVPQSHQYDILMHQQQCLAPSLTCSMATQTALPPTLDSMPFPPGLVRRGPPEKNVLATIYDFPSMEPLRFTEYSANHLFLPLRRDLLHRAVIYEADGTRQGTASTKWRSEVHGSGRKMRPQKGSGKARIGDKKSPMLRGGGVTFGPKPRDFSTKLPRKIYDLAWRTALSYRYRRGELVIVQKIEDGHVRGMRWLQEVMEGNRWGKPFGEDDGGDEEESGEFF